jgi:hypothetical protein
MMLPTRSTAKVGSGNLAKFLNAYVRGGHNRRMRSLYYLIAVMFVGVVHASTVIAIEISGSEIFRASDDRLYIKSASCRDVTDMTRSLGEWTLKTASSKSCKIDSNPPQAAGGKCTFDITDCVPELVAKYQGIEPKFAGPNCFNLALVLKEIIPALRYSPPEEAAFYIRPPLCRLLSSSVRPSSGDVGLIQDRHSNFKHAFIYISEKLAFSKNGNPKTIPYSLQDFNGVLSDYGVTNSNPKGCSSEKSERLSPDNCKNEISYYRCASMRDYLLSHPEVPKELLDAFENMAKFEHCLTKTVVEGEVLTPQSRDLILETGKALTKYLLEQSQIGQTLGMPNEEKNFLLAALQLRLRSIRIQLEGDKQLYGSYRSFYRETQALENEVKRASAELK